MAVGKRLRSRDEHLMLIIPMSSVTERWGDDRCPTVKWTWALRFGPCSTTQKWMSPTRWAFRPSPEQEPPKSSCSGTRMVTLVGHDSDGWDLDGQAVSPSFATCKAMTIALKCSPVGLNLEEELQPSDLRALSFLGSITYPVLSTSLNFLSTFLKFSLVPSLSQVPGFFDLFNFTDLTSLLFTTEHSYECASIHVDMQSILPFGREMLVDHLCVMAEEQAPASTSNTGGDDYAWVADEPRNTVSKFSLNGGEGMFRTVQRSPADDWKACIPNTSRRICSKFQWGSFPMYQIAFEQMGYRLPFSDFEVAVFRYLHLTPSQLHPNSLAFIRAFEMTAAYLGFMPTIPLFFHAFHLQRSKPKGDTANKFGWVSLKQSTKLFEMFLESVRGFKDSYFFVKPLNSISWQSVIYQGQAKDATGAPLVELSVEELSNYEQMKAFVDSFPRKYYEDEEGNPIVDDAGFPLTKKAFIDTKRLLACKSEAEMESCFQEMSTMAAKLRKSKAAKEKRQAAMLGASSNAAPSLGGDMMDNARSNVVVVDLEDVAVQADNQPRPAKIARVDQGNSAASGRTTPNSPKYVLPPAIGSPDLVKKSPVALSEAEQAIMNDMGPEALKNELADAMVAAFKLMEISSFLNGRECKYLEERDAAREEAVLANQRLEQAKVNHAAYKEKYTLQAGLVTKLAEKETEAARLVGEKAELEGRIKDLVTERDTLAGKVKDLESRPCSSGTAPDADELVIDPNGEYKGFTRAALVSRIFELEGKELDVAKSSFDNAVAQLMVLNPGVDLVVEGASEQKEVLDGVIVSPSPDEEDQF
ncbi:hypothetical protein TSUD_37810 [Trifolium subterraneum]|uniref:Transposase (putative) gypsy type domain-containing protein n=1 Tax=Trifolium subterraneum TaxID=3900 RepID=A0A2Z6LIK2_TRISU|nr:hypothetical protein TSUD_37810 [Trifolium subterraneum]